MKSESDAADLIPKGEFRHSATAGDQLSTEKNIVLYWRMERRSQWGVLVSSLIPRRYRKSDTKRVSRYPTAIIPYSRTGVTFVLTVFYDP